MTHTLSLLWWVAQGPKFYLGKFYSRSTFGVTVYMLLWLIAFPEALRNPCPEDTSCYGNCLLTIPILSNCFLDLNEPLILYYDSQCLNHAQPFLEAEKKFTQGCQNCWLCSLNCVQTCDKWTHMPCLISPPPDIERKHNLFQLNPSTTELTSKDLNNNIFIFNKRIHSFISFSSFFSQRHGQRKKLDW